jgi:hypothetical protein
MLVVLSTLPAKATEVVVVCKLASERDTRRPDVPPKSVDKEFVLKFDDVEKRVTYIAGPAIRVIDEPMAKYNFDNEISFLGDSVVRGVGPGIFRYSGTVSRLTGKIVLNQLWLDPNGIGIKSVPWLEDTGTCVAGPRKF